MDILGLTGIRILAIDEDAHDFHIQAESLSSPSYCAHCHSPHLYRHEIKPQLFIDLPIRGKRVGITMQRHRYRCCACHRTFFESLPGMNESHLMTNRLILYIQQEALRRTFVSIADEVGLGESTIRALFSEFAAHLQPCVPDTELLYLGIDELYLLHQYRCVITDVANHHIIDLLRERTKATVISYLQRLPDAIKEHIAVCVQTCGPVTMMRCMRSCRVPSWSLTSSMSSSCSLDAWKRCGKTFAKASQTSNAEP